MSVTGRGGSNIGAPNDDFMNWETIHWATYWDPSQPGDPGDDTGTIIDNQLLTNVDIDVPDQHVIAIHGFRFWLSDPIEQSGGSNAEVDMFIFDEELQDPVDGWNNRVDFDPMAQFSTQYLNDKSNGVGNGLWGTDPNQEYVPPILHADGKFAVQQVGTTIGAGTGETAVQMLYDFVPVEDQQRYLELLLRA